VSIAKILKVMNLFGLEEQGCGKRVNGGIAKLDDELAEFYDPKE
jgi:hypothetical protein